MSNVNPSAAQKDAGKVFAQRLLLRQPRDERFSKGFSGHGYLHEVYIYILYMYTFVYVHFFFFFSPFRLNRVTRRSCSFFKSDLVPRKRGSRNPKGGKERMTIGFQEVGNRNPRERSRFSSAIKPLMFYKHTRVCVYIYIYYIYFSKLESLDSERRSFQALAFVLMRLVFTIQLWREFSIAEGESRREPFSSLESEERS